MDLRTRLSQLRLRLAAAAGGLSVEAALGIGSVLAVFGLLAQATFTGVAYLRLLDAVVEAAQLASASGPRAERGAAATAWFDSQLPNANLELRFSDLEVVAVATQPLSLANQIWQPVMRVEISSPLVDSELWQ